MVYAESEVIHPHLQRFWHAYAFVKPVPFFADVIWCTPQQHQRHDQLSMPAMVYGLTPENMLEHGHASGHALDISSS